MNESIKTYISGMFTGLPQNDQVARAETELLEMASDKYAELRADGLSDSDATGRVITEFGNLDDVADALGIRDQLGGAAGDDPRPLISADAVDAAVAKAGRGYWIIAAGVALLIFGAAVSSFLSTAKFLTVDVQGSQDKTTVNVDFDWGGPFMIAAIFIAVAQFIVASLIFLKDVRPIQEREVRVSKSVADRYERLYEAHNRRFVIGLVTGISLIGFGVVLSAIFENNENVPTGTIQLVLIAIAVAMFIVVGCKRGLLKKVVRAGRPMTASEKAEEESESAVGMIAAIYWPLVVAIFLLWSFIFNAWSISWLIWPVAGLLFGALNAVIALRSKSKAKDSAA